MVEGTTIARENHLFVRTFRVYGSFNPSMLVVAKTA